jgi:hypothetical protein
MISIEYLGWAATAVFVASYFCTRSQTLKTVQMVGALMWIGYGLCIGASPVVVANLAVFAAAGWTLVRSGGLSLRDS